MNNEIASPPLQSVTVAVSNSGLGVLLKYITPHIISQSFTAPTMTAVSSPIEIPSTWQTIYVDKVTLSGGSINNIKCLSTPAIECASDNATVSFGASFHINYGTWWESGSVSSDPGGGQPDYSSYSHSCGAFSFDITNIDMQFDVSVPAGTSGSPLQWKLDVTDPTQSNVTSGNVDIPGGSELNGSPLPCIQSLVQSKVDSMVADVQYAQKVATALNGVLSTIPQSGNLSPDITYQFNPSCTPTISAEGVVAGITGLVQYKGADYPGTAVSIPLPAIDPTRDVVMNISGYEISAMLWAAYKNGDLQVNLTPATDNGSKTLNSAYYNLIWNQLYAFGQSKSATGVPLQVVAGAAAAPVVSIGKALELTPKIYGALKSQLNATAYAALAQMIGILYYTTSAFESDLKNYLAPADFTQYESLIVDAVTKNNQAVILSAPIKVSVTINYMDQGAWKPLISFTINRSNVLSNVSVQNNRLQFAFTQQNPDTITNVNVIEPALDGVATWVLNIVWALFSNYLNTQIESAGKSGCSLPSIPGFTLTNPTLALHESHGGYISLGAEIQQAP